jgi:hypothetical protein
LPDLVGREICPGGARVQLHLPDTNGSRADCTCSLSHSFANPARVGALAACRPLTRRALVVHAGMCFAFTSASRFGMMLYRREKTETLKMRVSLHFIPCWQDETHMSLLGRCRRLCPRALDALHHSSGSDQLSPRTRNKTTPDSYTCSMSLMTAL